MSLKFSFKIQIDNQKISSLNTKNPSMVSLANDIKELAEQRSVKLKDSDVEQLDEFLNKIYRAISNPSGEISKQTVQKVLTPYFYQLVTEYNDINKDEHLILEVIDEDLYLTGILEGLAVLALDDLKNKTMKEMLHSPNWTKQLQIMIEWRLI
jgi:hypothetical protein